MRYLLFQNLIVLGSSLLILSLECCKNEIYKESKKPTSCKEILANYPATPSGYTTGYNHQIISPVIRFNVIWRMNDVALRDGQELL